MSEVLDLAVPTVSAARAWLPEVLLVTTFLVATPLSLLGRRRAAWMSRSVTALGLFVAAGLAAAGLGDTAVLGADFQLDGAAALVRLVVCSAALLVVLLGALRWRTPPSAYEVPLRVHPFLALHALALCLLPQARNLAGAVVAVMGATLGSTLLCGLCARTPRARAAILRSSLAGATGAAVAVYGLSLRYALAATGMISAPPVVTSAWAVTGLLCLGGILAAVTALPALWSPGRGDGVGGMPAALTAYLAGIPLAAAAVLAWRLVPVAPSGPWTSVLVALAAALLAAGALGALGSRPPVTRFAWLSLSQAGYLVLALAAPPSAATATCLRHLVLMALGSVAAFGLRDLGGPQRRALTRVTSGLFLVGVAGLSPLVILALGQAGHPVLAAVASLGLISAAGYLRLAFGRWRS